MRAFWVAAIAVVLAAPATAAPDGFRDSFRLTQRIKALSGNQAAVVYCARSYKDWAVAVRAGFGPELRPETVNGFTNPNEQAAYFKLEVCSTLEGWLRGRSVTRLEMGEAAHTFAHEAVHLGGNVSEKAAECGSLARLATTLRVHFAVKNPVAAREMVRHAREANRNYGIPC